MTKLTIPNRTGLYIHIPFCAKKCPYCDFNTYAGLDDLQQATVDALCTEMVRRRDSLADRAIATIFVGGGTPTILTHRQLAQLFDAVHATFAVEADAEITCEANPGTVDRDRFALLRDIGVNRLSLGVQSFQQEELTFLGRIHDVADVTRAVDAARRAGFDNINLDFMFGLPGQSEAQWRNTLARALALAPEHLSLYSLIVEPNTPLHHWVNSGAVAAPDDDMAGLLYEIALEMLASAGYRHYEVSNWARAGTKNRPEQSVASPEASGAVLSATENDRSDPTAPHEFIPAYASRHNLIYWHNEDYLGIGPGAHSHLRCVDANGDVVSHRWGNRRSVQGYIHRTRQGADLVEFEEMLPTAVSMGETMMLGLRLLSGITFARFAQRHGIDMMQVYGDLLEQLVQAGLLAADEHGIRLTQRGLMMGNQVFLRFLAEPATM